MIKKEKEALKEAAKEAEKKAKEEARLKKEEEKIKKDEEKRVKKEEERKKKEKEKVWIFIYWEILQSTRKFIEKFTVRSTFWKAKADNEISGRRGEVFDHFGMSEGARKYHCGKEDETLPKVRLTGNCCSLFSIIPSMFH